MLVETALLLFERRRRYLGGVGIGGECGYDWVVRQVADASTVVPFVDLQVRVKYYRTSRNDPAIASSGPIRTVPLFCLLRLLYREVHCTGRFLTKYN